MEAFLLSLKILPCFLFDDFHGELQWESGRDNDVCSSAVYTPSA